MKRLIPILLVVLLVFSMSGCDKLGQILDIINETDAPTETEAPTEPAVTEAPVVTEAPTEEPTEAPTDEPVPPSQDLCAELDYRTAYAFDIDFDGLEDSIYIEQNQVDDWDYEVTIKIQRGCDPDNIYVYVVEYCYEFYAWVVDCYPDDNRLDILTTSVYASDDWTTVCFRVTNDGSMIEDYTDWFCIPADEMASYSQEEGFPILEPSDILGTRNLAGRMKLTERGFFLSSQDYEFIHYSEEYSRLYLKRDMDVELLSEEGIYIGDDTIPAGEYVIPVRTNCDDYIEFRTADGRLVRVELSVRSWEAYGDGYGIFINGVKQDEYFDLSYAD